MFAAVILGFVGFVTSFGAHIVAANLPFYAERVGAGLAVIGLLIAAYDLAEIVAKPVLGALADRQGMKRTMVAGIVAFTLAPASYPIVDPRWLLAIRFLHGVGAAALSAVSLALVGIYYPDRRGQAYGVHNTLKGLGYVVSPLVGGLVVARTTFSGIFLVSAGVGVLALILSLALPSPKGERDADTFDDDFSLPAILGVFREPKTLSWYGVTVVNMFFVGVLFGFLPVRAHGLGLGPLASGLLSRQLELCPRAAGGWVACGSVRRGRNNPHRAFAFGHNRDSVPICPWDAARAGP